MNRALLGLLVLVVSGCVHRAPVECGAPIEVPAEVIQSRIVLMGEVHGTQEIPRFVGDLACRLAQAGKSIVIALEFPDTEQAALDAYLVSSGDKAARRALTASDFWSHSAQDGRRSVAMVALIEQARVLKHTGRLVSLLAIDVPWGKKVEVPRDTYMANSIDRAAVLLPSESILIVLAGNIHTARVEKYPGLQVPTPMGYQLKSPDVIAFNAKNEGGYAMIFGSPSGGTQFRPCSPTGRPRAISLFSQPDERGYSGGFHVGCITASPHFIEAEPRT